MFVTYRTCNKSHLKYKYIRISEAKLAHLYTHFFKHLAQNIQITTLATDVNVLIITQNLFFMKVSILRKFFKYD